VLGARSTVTAVDSGTNATGTGTASNAYPRGETSNVSSFNLFDYAGPDIAESWLRAVLLYDALT